jgi:hypothetical protein
MQNEKCRTCYTNGVLHFAFSDMYARLSRNRLLLSARRGLPQRQRDGEL